MGKSLRTGLMIVLCASFLLAGSLPGSADATLEEVKRLLQKGLTLAELDQEIARLSARELRLGEDIVKTEAEMEANRNRVAEARQHAGKVLRAYYMGDREQLWMMLFTARSLSEALTVYEYMTMILENDHRSLNAYSASYQELDQVKRKLEEERADLQTVKAAFTRQREAAAAVQKDIEETLRDSADAAALQAELDRFTAEWKEKGIPLFRKYLSSISTTMQSLPELLTGKDADKYVSTDLFKGTMTFSITDTELNAFFRAKNPAFENITFRFEDDRFVAFGDDNGVNMSITGRYAIESKPVNRLAFHVDTLTYNGFTLPETSNRSLEQEFDLGFTPSKFVSGFADIEITEITIKGGKLGLKLKLK